jgi:hypothetical protein
MIVWPVTRGVTAVPSTVTLPRRIRPMAGAVVLSISRPTGPPDVFSMSMRVSTLTARVSQSIDAFTS